MRSVAGSVDPDSADNMLVPVPKADVYDKINLSVCSDRALNIDLLHGMSNKDFYPT